MENKTTNVEKLKKIGILGAVRQRMGADDENDDVYDEDINKLGNSELVEKYCGWELGDGSWWTDFKYFFDSLCKMEQKS